jgi:hypothetical protein
MHSPPGGRPGPPGSAVGDLLEVQLDDAGVVVAVPRLHVLDDLRSQLPRDLAPGLAGERGAVRTESLPGSPAGPAARTFLDYVARAGDRRKAWEDVLWVLLRSKEFIYRY